MYKVSLNVPYAHMPDQGGIDMDANFVKEQICDVCHKMWQLGWVAANDGNVCV